MTYQSTGEMHTQYSSSSGGWQQLVYTSSSSTNISALTIYATGMSAGTYCKIFIPSIHGGDITAPHGFAFVEAAISITFVQDAGGVGNVYIGQESGNTNDFDVRWFPSLIGRGSASLVDPTMPFTGNRPNWLQWGVS